jgi:hypothetical protein
VIDSLEMPTREQTDKVISLLIENEEIKGILTKDALYKQVESERRKDMDHALITVPNYV